jgi:hypothetical protein
MTYPMPPELLEQLGLEPCADTDPCWPEDNDALGCGRRVATRGGLEELDDRDRRSVEDVPDGRRRRSAL